MLFCSVHLYENPSFSRLLPPAGGGGGGGGNTESGPETPPESGGGGGGIDSCTLSKGRRRRKSFLFPFPPSAAVRPPTDRPPLVSRNFNAPAEAGVSTSVRGEGGERRFSVFSFQLAVGEGKVCLSSSFAAISPPFHLSRPPQPHKTHPQAEGRRKRRKEKVGISLSIWENC